MEDLYNIGITHQLDYTYDGLGQLTDASMTNINSSTWTADYAYRKDGNVSSKTESGSTTNYQYNTTTGGSVFDSDIMTKAGSDLTWDVGGRLTESVTASLEYNWDGKLCFTTTGREKKDVKNLFLSLSCKSRSIQL